jgi:hypothetical protein
MRAVSVKLLMERARVVSRTKWLWQRRTARAFPSRVNDAIDKFIERRAARREKIPQRASKETL